MNKLALRADTLLAKVPENYEKPKQLDWCDSNRNAVRHGEVLESGLTGVTRKSRAAASFSLGKSRLSHLLPSSCMPNACK
jgi:hypothetical protein